MQSAAERLERDGDVEFDTIQDVGRLHYDSRSIEMEYSRSPRCSSPLPEAMLAERERILETN